MWRISRLGIKTNCLGNQTHFRIIGTTCANADDKAEDINDTSTFVDNPTSYNKKSLASIASTEFHNFLTRKTLFRGIHSFAQKYNFSKDVLKVCEPVKEKKREKFTEDTAAGFYRKNSVVLDLKERGGSGKDNGRVAAGDTEEKFGSLSKRDKKFECSVDERELVGSDNAYGEKLTENCYGRKILALCKERKLKEALEVLEVEMKVQHVIPNGYCYNILINACGKVGYTKKAFELYYQMKRRGIKVEKFAYTGLFNACANSPFKAEGLEWAKHLRKQMETNLTPVHEITYHAMIKAFGHCGDIKTAFEIVDEMFNKKCLITTTTMNFLLHACISDKENGFRHALMVWRKMRSMKIPPCIYSYNLLLHCVRDCNAGDSRLFSEFLNIKVTPEVESKKIELIVYPSEEKEKPLEKQSPEDSKREKMKLEGKSDIVKVDLGCNMELEIFSRSPGNALGLPDLLSVKIDPGNVVAIESLDKRDERLSLLGGVSRVLENMLLDKVKPTVASFTLLLESLQADRETELALLASMERYHITPDLIFFNKLIHQRCIRKSRDEAKEVLELMQKYHIMPDLITFGSLAAGCFHPRDITTLLNDMKRAGFTPNEEIMIILLKNCRISQHYEFIVKLLKHLDEYNIIPTEKILNVLEDTRNKARQSIVKQEEAEKDAVVLSSKDKTIREEKRFFLMEYSHWLKKSKLDLGHHPWKQFGYPVSANKEVTTHAS